MRKIKTNFLLIFAAFSFSTNFVCAKNNATFPRNFLFGVATSSYQVEGAWNEDGKGENIWDHMIHAKPTIIKNNNNGDIACDSYHKYEEDVELAAGLGATHYSFSISWSRILPAGYASTINRKGLLYYKNLINEIRKHNMIPVATLYHWDLPQALQDIGGWTSPSLVDHFVKYSRIAIQNLQDVGYWITINGPKQICVRGYGDGSFAPGVNNTGIAEYMCAYVIVKAHAATYRMYKKEFAYYKAKMSIVLDGEWNEPASDRKADIEAAERRNQFEFGLYANPIFNSNWPEVVINRIYQRSRAEGYQRSRLPAFTPEEIKDISGTFDFMGFTTYSTHLVADDEEADFTKIGYEKDIRAVMTDHPNWKRGSNKNTIVPWGARKMLRWIKETYNNPDIFLMGNGVADDGTSLNDYQRIEFYTQYLSAILDSMYEDGVKIFGFTAWSLIDNFEWIDGYSQHFGLYYVDFRDSNKRRIPKRSVEFFRNLTTTGVIPGVDSAANNLIVINALLMFIVIVFYWC